MSGPDRAFLLDAREWLLDEHTAAMSLEAKGAFIDLLAHQWLEGSIPADVDRLGKLLRVSPARMRRLWSELEARFPPAGGGRLANQRLESERQKLADARAAKSDAAKRASARRWQCDGNAGAQRRQSRRKANAVREHCGGNAILSTSTPPNPPLPDGVRPHAAGATESAAGAAPDPEGSAPAGAPDSAATAAGPEQESLEQESPVSALCDALERLGFERNSFRRLLAAKRLVERGMTEQDLRELAAYARGPGDDPTRLLAKWIHADQWRGVLDEQRAKARAFVAQQRRAGAPAQVGEDAAAEIERIR